MTTRQAAGHVGLTDHTLRRYESNEGLRAEPEAGATQLDTTITRYRRTAAERNAT